MTSLSLKRRENQVAIECTESLQLWKSEINEHVSFDFCLFVVLLAQWDELKKEWANVDSCYLDLIDFYDREVSFKKCSYEQNKGFMKFWYICYMNRLAGSLMKKREKILAKFIYFSECFLYPWWYMLLYIQKWYFEQDIYI